MNKKGVGMLDIIVAITVISIASSMFMTLLWGSYKTVLVGERKVLSAQVAESYHSLISSEIKDSFLTGKDAGESYLLSNYGDSSCMTTCSSAVGNASSTYSSLYGETSAFELNGDKFRNTIVRVEIVIRNTKYSIKTYDLTVSIRYSGAKEVKYSAICLFK